MTGFAAVRESGFGTRLTKPDVAACPQPGEAGIRLPERDSRLSSRPEEFHLRALPEPCMTLSSHTAPDVRPWP